MKQAWPCKKCPDNTNGKRELGICNHGLGICKSCMDYHEARGDELRAELAAEIKRSSQ